MGFQIFPAWFLRFYTTFTTITFWLFSIFFPVRFQQNYNIRWSEIDDWFNRSVSIKLSFRIWASIVKRLREVRVVIEGNQLRPNGQSVKNHNLSQYPSIPLCSLISTSLKSYTFFIISHDSNWENLFIRFLLFFRRWK